MNDLEWLKALKVGDEVVVNGRLGESIRKVTKVNEKYVTVGASKFSLKTGHNQSQSDLLPATQEARDRIERTKLADSICSAALRIRFDRERIPLYSLRELAKAMKAVKAAKQPKETA